MFILFSVPSSSDGSGWKAAGSTLTRHGFPAGEIWTEAKCSCMNLEAYTYHEHWGWGILQTCTTLSEAQWAEIWLCSARPGWSLHSKLLGAPGKLPSSLTPDKGYSNLPETIVLLLGFVVKRLWLGRGAQSTTYLGSPHMSLEGEPKSAPLLGSEDKRIARTLQRLPQVLKAVSVPCCLALGCSGLMPHTGLGI